MPPASILSGINNGWDVGPTQSPLKQILFNVTDVPVRLNRTYWGGVCLHTHSFAHISESIDAAWQNTVYGNHLLKHLTDKSTSTEGI